MCNSLLDWYSKSGSDSDDVIEIDGDEDDDEPEPPKTKRTNRAATLWVTLISMVGICSLKTL